LAFGAHPPDPGEAAHCFVMWRPATHDFLDPCTKTVYPADGTGLDHYATRVDPSGEVVVNLRQAIGPTPAQPPAAAP